MDADGDKPPAEASFVNNAREEVRAGHFDRALALLDKVGKDSAANADALDLRGEILLEQGRFDDARKAFTAASEANHTRFSPKLHLGDVLLREKKYSEARDAYMDLLRDTNVQVPAEKLRYAILLSYLFAQDETHASSALDRIPFPTASPAYYYAQAVWEFAHGRQSEGRKWLHSASKMFDDESIAWFARPLYSIGWLKGKPPVPAS